jgi:hypothetical protein
VKKITLLLVIGAAALAAPAAALGGKPDGVGKPDKPGRPDGVGKLDKPGRPDGAGEPEPDRPDGAGKPGAGKPDHPGSGHAVNYVFKGAYAGDGSTVAVDHGNKHVRRAGLEDTDVVFDFAASKVVVADTNADGAQDLGDVVAGDRVVVKARLPKGDPGAQPFAAKQLVDRTNSAGQGTPVGS